VAEATQKLSNDLIGVAGVHFVAFKLSLRGLIVLPTIRNTAGMDLLVNDPRTMGQASLQVKTSMQWVKFWPTSKFDKCLRGPRTFYVFLRYDSQAESFEAFLESGNRVAQQVEANAQDYRERGRKEFSFWRLPSAESEIDKLREAWCVWLPLECESSD
jgi:hypothetical protein